jgi:5-hydroxyisourate hydrolase-like protein (transthyretin family)
MQALDRFYVPQYSAEVLGMEIRVAGVPADPDGSAVTVRMTRDADSVVILDRAATRADTGRYEITLSSAESQTSGNYTLRWSYTVATVPRFEDTVIEIGRAEPFYDNLVPEMRALVDGAWMRFEDLFDSPFGGPNLQTYFQTRFDRGSAAKLLRVAVGILNTAAQPYQSFTIDGDGGAAFPVAQWGALLEQALYVEMIKHLRRSYTEQPIIQGSNVTRLDRRDYFDRWGIVLADEQAQLKSQLDTFKIRAMMLGRPVVRVSGGVYGRWGGIARSPALAARPSYWMRAY